MQGIFFAAGNLMVLMASAWLAEVLLPSPDRLKRAVAVLAGHPVLASLILLALGSVGRLTVGPVLGATAGAMLLAALARWRFSKSAEPAWPAAPRSTAELHAGAGDERQRLRLACGGQDARPPTAVVFLFGAFAALAVAAGMFLGTRLVWDDHSYHAPAVAQWFIDGRLSLAPFWYQAYYPLNAELLSLWFFLPFGTDAFVSLAGIWWLALLIVSAMSIVRSQGSSWQAALTVGLILLSSTFVASSALTFSATDLAGPALTLAAICLLLPEGNAGSIRPSYTQVAYAGLLAGLAAGCKVSFIPIAAVLLVWIAWRARSDTWSMRVRLVIVFSLCAVVTGAYWYVRNAVLTGNPLFPAEVGPFSGPFHQQAQRRTQLISWFLYERAPAVHWLRAIGVYLWWPLGAWIISTAGIVMAARRILRRPRSAAGIAPRSYGVEPILLLLALVLLVLFPLMPLSGTEDSPAAELKPYPRYVITPFVLGVVLYGLHVDGFSRKAQRFWWYIVLFGIITCRLGPVYYSYYVPGWIAGHWFVSFGIAAIGGVAALWLARRAGGVRWLVPRRVALRWVALGIALVAVGAWAPIKQAMTDESVYAFLCHRHSRIGELWRAAAALPAGANLAFFGPGAYLYYPYFGRHMQFRPRYVGPNGDPPPPLHELWCQRPDVRWWTSWDRSPPTYNHLMADLHNAGIDYVVVTQFDGDYWVRQYQVLKDSPETKIIYDDGYSVIFQCSRVAK